MKKLTLYMATAFMLFPFVPTQLKAGITTNTVPVDSTKTAETAAINALTFRLEEINALDKSKLSAQERRALRKEVRSIKSEVSAQGGGIYLSVGALLIVILLLILLL